jgi:hypothetical protein
MNRIDEIGARLKAAKPAFWRVVRFRDTEIDIVDANDEIVTALSGHRELDAVLIAAAPQDLRYLVHEVERLKNVVGGESLSFGHDMAVEPGAELITTVVSEVTFRPKRLVVPADIATNFHVDQMEIETRHFQGSDGHTDGWACCDYTPTSHLHLFGFGTVFRGQSVTLRVRNVGAVVSVFQGTLIGPGEPEDRP